MKRTAGALAWITALLVATGWATAAAGLARPGVRREAAATRTEVQAQVRLRPRTHAPVSASAQARAPPRVEAGEPDWIWAPDQPPGSAPVGACYFRKVFQL